MRNRRSFRGFVMLSPLIGAPTTRDRPVTDPRHGEEKFHSPGTMPLPGSDGSFPFLLPFLLHFFELCSAQKDCSCGGSSMQNRKSKPAGKRFLPGRLIAEPKWMIPANFCFCRDPYPAIFLVTRCSSFSSAAFALPDYARRP